MTCRRHAFFLAMTAILLASCANQEIKHTRSKADIFYSHGTSSLMKKNYTEALSLLLKAEKLRPNDTKIHNNLGMAYFFKKKPAQAEFHLKKAIELDQTNSDARNNLASIYTRINRIDEAISLYKQVTNDLIYQHQYRAYYGLALIELERNNYVMAVEYLNKTLEEKNDYCPAHFKLGEISERRNNYTEAYERYKKATLGTCVNQPAPHYQQAIALINLSRYDEARSKLQEIAEKFSTTRYSQLAVNKLNSIKNLGNFELTKEDILRKHRKQKTNSYKSLSF